MTTLSQEERLKIERYELITFASSDGVYDWKVSDNSLYVSNRLNELFDFETGSLTSDSWVGRLHPDDVDTYVLAIRAHFRGETVRLQCEYRILNNAGDYIWVRDRAAAQRDDKGRAVRLVGLIQDITEEAERNQALEEANLERERILSEFNTVLENISYGIMFLDADLRLRYVNRPVREMWQMDEAFLASQPTWLELMNHNRKAGLYSAHEDDWDAFVEERTALLMNGTDDPQELSQTDGSTLQVLYVCLPDGGRMVTYYDVTNFKALESGLRASDQRYEAVMRVVGEGVYDWDIVSDDIYYSPAVSEMLGLAEGILSSKAEEWMARVYADDREAYTKKFADTFSRGEEQFQHEYRFVRSDDAVRWARQRGHVEYDDEGQAIRVIGSTGDVTAEMEMKTELDTIRQRLSDAIEAMPEGFACFDAEDRIAITNSRFQSFFEGLQDHAKVGMPFGNLIKAAVDRNIFAAKIDNFEDWYAKIVEARRVASSSREQVLTRGVTLQISERRTTDGGLVAIYTDITDLKNQAAELSRARDQAHQALDELTEAQDKLVHAEKMASLGQLAAGIAHEIKNPLNFVNNFAKLSAGMLEELVEIIVPVLPQLAEDDREEADDLMKTVIQNLEKIEEHGSRADGIVRNMLAHSRDETGERITFDINTMLAEALNLAYHGARAENSDFNITLLQELAPDLPSFSGYQQELSRVFLNIFANGMYATAQRAAAEGGVYAPEIAVSSRLDGEHIRISVRDNGSGIPDHVRDRIFEPFFTTKPAGEGTGLGLSLSFDIVTKQHGGTFEVESETGIFTEFAITLPMAI
ncbi:MAG: PAS domain-containing protein [Alphaproteobacteria bacterium]|jgi:PAS domain S-box-containing protein|nr:PAS domain-containing protein [Alphaproteobacteria bacterium]MBT4083828.1 PAS domain-containing protein [Alphaproteobacteria bacterium]MBT4542868.1 PAS domain-containing protein [Alphaproteobacteria bacterium]MBT7744244.1 PAS domain-containing protein [Alphaproteobacteria bacterium]